MRVAWAIHPKFSPLDVSPPIHLIRLKFTQIVKLHFKRNLSTFIRIFTENGNAIIKKKNHIITPKLLVRNYNTKHPIAILLYRTFSTTRNCDFRRHRLIKQAKTPNNPKRLLIFICRLYTENRHGCNFLLNVHVYPDSMAKLGP